MKNKSRPRNSETVKALLSHSSEAILEEVDASKVVSMVKDLERHSQKNEIMRGKHPHDPLQFMDSEIILHSSIRRLRSVGIDPSFFPILVSEQAIPILFRLLSHENSDISCEVLSILSDWTEPETNIREMTKKDMEGKETLLHAILSCNGGLELLIDNISRYDASKSDVEVNGIFDTFQIVENIVEFDPATSMSFLSKTRLLHILLQILQAKNTTSIKVYASELLSIILQLDLENTRFMSPLFQSTHSKNLDGKSPKELKITEPNGLDLLLEAIALYRKEINIRTDEDEECLRNMSNALCCLLTSNHIFQDQFRQLEGFELIYRCMKYKSVLRTVAFRVLDHAVSHHIRNCQYAIESGGLQWVFPCFMGKLKLPGMNPVERDRLAVSITSSFCQNITSDTEEKSKFHAYERLYGKFIEHEFAKSDRVIELLKQYHSIYGNDAEKSSLDSDTGIFTLHHLSLIVGVLLGTTHSLRMHVLRKLQEGAIHTLLIKKHLCSFASSLTLISNEEVGGNDTISRKERRDAQRERIIHIIKGVPEVDHLS